MPADSLRDKILGLMRSRGYQPMTKSEFSRELGVSSNERAELRKSLDSLASEGVITLGNKARYELRERAGNLLTGTLKFHPKGHAFFFPDATEKQNLATGLDLVALSRIHVARRDAGAALDGDKVMISVHLPSPRRPSRRLDDFPDEPRGKVEKIVERRSGRLVGIFRTNGRYSWVDSHDNALGGRIDVIGDTTAVPGQLVVVDLKEWPDRALDPRGRIVEVLGWPGDPGVEIRSVIHRFGLRTSFSEEVLEEARRVAQEPDEKEIARRQDWREKLIITIDPADAKDHDDAIWLEKAANGWTLAVHIADVSHYVKPGSGIDKEAIARGNSTYLVDRVLPMLPTILSNGICSLKPDVTRLTKCALMHISDDGAVQGARFFDAVIHSRVKLSYEQAQAILDGGDAPEGSDPAVVPLVREAWKMASALRRRRFENGALDLEMPEIKVHLDESGRPVSVDPVIHTASHQLIEECMLAANQAVARALNTRQKPAVFRVHEEPDPSRLQDYTETAKLHGYRPGDLTNRLHIQKLLDDSKGSPEEHVIKLGLLKSLKRAAYSAEPLGHYGLAKGDYCHFTSPIRRYADLIVHRALQPLLENAPQPADRTPSQADLVELARHISDTERNSAEAEGETKQAKLLEYLKNLAEARDPNVMDGLVTDVRAMGLMVEVPHLGVRGVVKREDLPHGSWRFEGHRMAWASFDGRSIHLGMRVPLQVKAIDMERRFVDFTMRGQTLAELKHPVPPRPTKKHAKPKPKPAAKAGPPNARTRRQTKATRRRRRK
jgi:ribonuclease R